MGVLSRTLKSCKETLYIKIFHDTTNNYWLQSRVIGVNLGLEFAASGTDLLQMLELSYEKREAVEVCNDGDIIQIPHIEAGNVERLEHTITIDDISYYIFKTDKGAMFVRSQYLRVFDTYKKDSIFYYMSHTEEPPVLYVVANGDTVGYVSPSMIEYNKICSFASKLMKLTFKARSNGFMCAAEQISLDDGANDDEQG